MLFSKFRNYCHRQWPVLKQFCADAVGPFFLISAYAVYVSWHEHDWSGVKLIASWSQAAIIVGTLATYYLRAKKQVQDGTRHGDVLTQLQGLIQQTDRVVGWTTGGEGFARLAAVTVSKDVLTTARFVIRGGYPLYELNVRVVDIDEFQTGIENPIRSEAELDAAMRRGLRFTHKFNAAIPPDFSYTLVLNIPLRPKERNHFHIQWSARNGLWYERLELVATEQGWLSATSVSRGSKEISASRAPGFPVNADGTARFSASLPAAQQINNLDK